jgi:AcrR family transcriptional regulator
VPKNVTAAPPLPLGARERGKNARRARIAAAAGRIFREKGYEDATLREIAAQAGVGTGTIFSYARDKRELLLLALNDELEALTDRSFATVPRGAPLLDQLMHVFMPRLKFWARDPELARNALHYTAGDARDAETSSFAAGRNRMIERLAGLLEPHRAAGRIDTDLDIMLVSRMLLDVYVGENRRWLATNAPVATAGRRNLQAVLALAIRGIEPRSR